ncbi:MAG: Loki-CTERM sorting domain-containing protein [Promethearchaeota archaeon]
MGDFYTWDYTGDMTARDGDWTTDGIALSIFMNFGGWMGWINDDEMGFLMPGNMTHEITVVDDLAPDLEYGTNNMTVLYTGAVVYDYAGGPFDWADKDTGINLWNGIIFQHEADFVAFHDGLGAFFGPYGFPYQSTSLVVSTNLDWTEVVTIASPILAAVNATVTVVNNGTDDVGFKITVAASAWGTNTLALELESTWDECGLLDVWEVTYGPDTIMKIEQTVGSTCSPCPPGADAIPGYGLPIIIGVVSVVSLILIKKIKKK